MPSSDLQAEIDERRRAIKTDSYAMSIGELMSIYENRELELHPEFQRFFRWTLEQKTRLIESILLGIPLPPVFVSQAQDGVWDVIDGLQRLSTIFQFSGLLHDAKGHKVPPLPLLRAKYLPKLEGKIWENKDNPNDPNAFTTQQRIDLKRSKIDVKIIQRESDSETKFDLFERLNTGGTRLSDQEVRNCLLIMTSPTFFVWFNDLTDYANFQEIATITDKTREERYDMELVVRFLVLRNIAPDNLRKIEDVNSLLSDQIISLAEKPFDYRIEEEAFKKTFDLLLQALGDDAFRRYDVNKQKYAGSFTVSVFEVMGIGLGHNIDKWANVPSDLDRIREISKSIWSDVRFTRRQGTGVSGSDRLRHLIPLGRELFAHG